MLPPIRRKCTFLAISSIFIELFGLSAVSQFRQGAAGQPLANEHKWSLLEVSPVSPAPAPVSPTPAPVSPAPAPVSPAPVCTHIGWNPRYKSCLEVARGI